MLRNPALSLIMVSEPRVIDLCKSVRRYDSILPYNATNDERHTIDTKIPEIGIDHKILFPTVIMNSAEQ